MRKFLWLMVVLFAGFSTLFISDCAAQPKLDDSVILKKGKATYHVSKATELAHIAIAMSEPTANWANVVDTTTQYYKEVKAYFEPYRNHEAVKETSELLAKNIMKYIFVVQTGSAAALQNGDLYSNKRFPWLREWWPKLNSTSRKKLEDFAKTSRFESFYESHRSFYVEELSKTATAIVADSIQIWLESEFPERYDEYHFAVSPLMNATHFTNRFKLKGVQTCWMWTPTFDASQYKTPELQSQGIFTGVVFTEIDHNYVNPVSDKYKRRLKRIMGDEFRDSWVDASGDAANYGNGYKIFNEYMTHAVYLLYTQLRYAAEDQSVIEKSRFRLMVERRKYKRFIEFYQELQRLYINRQQGETIESLYPKMLDWVEGQNVKKAVN